MHVVQDAALRSIKNLHELSLEKTNDIHKREVFLACHNALEQSINTFETLQQNVSTPLVKLDRSDGLEIMVANISEKMKKLCGVNQGDLYR